ncbi:hypothetical protein [Psychrosphaera haliotis]|uniref:Uncharacterized protein n=1 Tax=Psychrosphaera haliotis TaxID=555083 RepID=A0A6N8FAH5_9GAMM|nr:hypothetical protein [Psychrosphaera haliotis]MUH73463.1 hypothetical protein [Psychrosphaera haliotis]
MAKPDKLQRTLVRWGETQSAVFAFYYWTMSFCIGWFGLYLGANVGLVANPRCCDNVAGVLVTLKGYLGIVANRLAFFRHQHN